MSFTEYTVFRDHDVLFLHKSILPRLAGSHKYNFGSALAKTLECGQVWFLDSIVNLAAIQCGSGCSTEPDT